MLNHMPALPLSQYPVIVRILHAKDHNCMPWPMPSQSSSSSSSLPPPPAASLAAAAAADLSLDCSLIVWTCCLQFFSAIWKCGSSGCSLSADWKEASDDVYVSIESDPARSNSMPIWQGKTSRDRHSSGWGGRGGRAQRGYDYDTTAVPRLTW